MFRLITGPVWVGSSCTGCSVWLRARVAYLHCESSVVHMYPLSHLQSVLVREESCGTPSGVCVYVCTCMHVRVYLQCFQYNCDWYRRMRFQRVYIQYVNSSKKISKLGQWAVLCVCVCVHFMFVWEVYFSLIHGVTNDVILYGQCRRLPTEWVFSVSFKW